MAVTVNLRNNTDFFVKVTGIEEVISPNTPLEDKTIQWVSQENKQISFFTTQDCSGAPTIVGSISFVTNDGIFVDRGNITGAQSIKLMADITGTPISISQLENNGATKLLEWSQIDQDTVVNLSFDKI